MSDMTIEEYRDLLDRRYRGESVALNAEEAARIRKRAARAGFSDTADEPFWLIVEPDGSVEGCHAYRDGSWDSEESVWKRFEPRKQRRTAMIAEGWTVRRDDDQHTGRQQLYAKLRAESGEKS